MIALLFVLGTLVVLGGTAHAQRGRNKNPEAARLKHAEFAERDKDYAQALQLYTDSYAAAPSPTTLAGIGRCQIALGQWPEAFDTYTTLATVLPANVAAKQHIREHLAEAQQHTGTISLSVKPSGASVTLDGAPVGTGPLMLARRVAAGKHVVVATKPGQPPQELNVDVPGNGGNVVAEIPDTAAAASTATAPGATPAGADGGAPAPNAADAGAPPPAVGPQGGEVAAPAGAAPGAGPPAEAPAEGSGAWNVPHGTMKFAPLRTDTPPKIDGDLSDPVWQKAVKDRRFLSSKSKPYGQPGSEPTEVQIAYDAENLYVAVRCGYSGKRPRDDTYTADETTLFIESESFVVSVDPLHTHTTGFAFAVSRAGARADAEVSDGGQGINFDWRGIWDVEVRRGPDAWVAEFKIPWGTMRMPSAAGPISMGLNFTRHEPGTGEQEWWSLGPPTLPPDINFFGHLEPLVDIRPDQRLYLQPYVAFAYESRPPPQQSRLTDFTGTNGRLSAYAGAYARYQPPGPLRLDATFNPNFSAVNPDQALANFDRFEPQFPEARPFFAEDAPRFQFGGTRGPLGDLGAQLFYTRRIGLVTDVSGLTEAVPILYGVKSVLKTDTTEAAVMNVGLSPATPKVSMNDNVSVGRVTESFGEGRHIGAIILGRTGSIDHYVAGGADGAMTIFDRHMTLSGFYAASASDENKRSGAGQVSLDWASEDFYASAAYLDVGTDFDAQLGYFPITGMRNQRIAAGYTPVIRSDLLQRMALEGQLSIATDRADQRIFDRGVVSATATTLEDAFIQVQVRPSIEQVTPDFPLANGRINVVSGRYEQMVLYAAASTAPRRPVVVGVNYTGGDLYGGTQRAPAASLGLNLGRFSMSALYRLFLIEYGLTSLTGHQLSASASYGFSPLAKQTFVIETNTISARGLVQSVTSYIFGQLSEIDLVLRATSGSTPTVTAADWSDTPNLSAILTFALGVSPF